MLEDYLEVPLFERSHRSIRLTAEGARLFPAASRALDEINAAVASLSMRGRRDVLVVQTYSTFAQRWLIPRLWRFHERLPKVEIRLSASVAPVDFERGQIHAAIQRRSALMERCDADFLAPVELLPVCSPSLTEDWNKASMAKMLLPADASPLAGTAERLETVAVLGRVQKYRSEPRHEVREFHPGARVAAT